MDSILIKKYINNSCSEEELRTVLSWLADPVRTDGNTFFSELWEESDKRNDEIDYNFMLDKIHHKINLTRSKNILERLEENPISFKRKEHSIKMFSRAAAILLFPVLVFSVYMTGKYQAIKHAQNSANQSYNEVHSSVDAIAKVILPDGSGVWLNHLSSLKYPPMFSYDSRTVELTGEGYFEVAHNPEVPFIVKAGNIQVKAVGTTFNVMAYPDQNNIETALISGKVELNKICQNGKRSTMLIMKPNEFAVFHAGTGKLDVRTITDDRYSAWKDGRLVFIEEPMGRVVEKLSRWFNVDFEIKDKELLDLTYTATIFNETLPQVMELMSQASPIRYSISKLQMLKPGVFSKRKVILCYSGNKTKPTNSSQK